MIYKILKIKFENKNIDLCIEYFLFTVSRFSIFVLFYFCEIIKSKNFFNPIFIPHNQRQDEGNILKQ